MFVDSAYVKVGKIPTLRIPGLTQRCLLPPCTGIQVIPLGHRVSPLSPFPALSQCVMAFLNATFLKIPCPAEAAQNQIPPRRHLLSLNSSWPVTLAASRIYEQAVTVLGNMSSALQPGRGSKDTSPHRRVCPSPFSVPLCTLCLLRLCVLPLVRGT